MRLVKPITRKLFHDVKNFSRFLFIHLLMLLIGLVIASVIVAVVLAEARLRKGAVDQLRDL